MPSWPDTTVGFIFHGPLDQGRRPIRFKGRTVAFRTDADTTWRVGVVGSAGVWMNDGTNDGTNDALVPLDVVTLFIDLDQVKA